MATDYERFLFGEMRTADATGHYEYALDILCLGFKMYPLAQMLEYALTASEGMRKAAQERDMPVAFVAVWNLPMEMFKHRDPPTIWDTKISRCYDNPDFAWYYLKVFKDAKNAIYMHGARAAMQRIWYDEGWLKYRPPTSNDMSKLFDLIVPNKSQAKRLALRGARHSPGEWARICTQTHFSRNHERIRREVAELEILMGFKNDDAV